jgi:hypothetical protein
MHLPAGLLRAIAFLAALALASSLAISQLPSGSFSVVVKDPTGDVVPGAAVAIKNTKTGVENKYTTNNLGSTNAPGLLPGYYEIIVEKEDFAKSVTSNVRLEVGIHKVDVKLDEKKTDIFKVKTKAEILILNFGYGLRVTPEEAVEYWQNSIAGNLLDLVKVMHVNLEEIYGADDRKLAYFNVEKDGVTANNTRWAPGINIPANLHPKTINEFQIFLPPGNTAAVSSKFGVVTGRVFDKSGKAIQNAIVKIGKKQCTTNEDGSYSISDLQPGLYDISIGKTKYKKASLRKQLIDAGSIQIDVQLKLKKKK